MDYLILFSVLFPVLILLVFVANSGSSAVRRGNSRKKMVTENTNSVDTDNHESIIDGGITADLSGDLGSDPFSDILYRSADDD